MKKFIFIKLFVLTLLWTGLSKICFAQEVDSTIFKYLVRRYNEQIEIVQKLEDNQFVRNYIMQIEVLNSIGRELNKEKFRLDSLAIQKRKQ